MIDLPLAKFQMSYRWDPSQHPRDDAGRFTGSGGAGGAPSFRQRGLLEPSPGPGNERRSLTRGETWQRIGAKLPELPISYTGSRQRELPADWFSAPPKITWQVPPTMPVDEHIATLGSLRQIVKDLRRPTTEKAQRTHRKVAVNGIKDFFTEKRRIGDLILPTDTPRGAISRAYNHAAMMALHNFGVVDYDFPKMSEPMKAELEPLVPFMRYVHRRLTDEFSKAPSTRGKRRAYVQAFGTPFADNRRHAVTGEVRLRLRPNQQFVKGVDVPGLPLAKVDAAERAKVSAVMHEWKAGKLRSWRGRAKSGKQRRGPVVASRQQAIAIALNSARRMAKRAPGCIDERVTGMMDHVDGIIHRAGRQNMKSKTSRGVKRVLRVVDQILGPQAKVSTPTPVDRLRANDVVANHRLPLAHVTR